MKFVYIERKEVRLRLEKHKLKWLDGQVLVFCWWRKKHVSYLLDFIDNLHSYFWSYLDKKLSWWEWNGCWLLLK